MRTLFSLGSKHLAHRRGRSALTALGIVLGVAVLFGVLVSNATTQTGVDRLIRDFVGTSDVLINATGAFDATMPEDTLERVRRLPNVQAAAGHFRLDTAVPEPGEEEPLDLAVRGIDLEASRRLQPFPLARGRFFRPGAREVVVSAPLAERLKLRPGSVLRIDTVKGKRPVRVSGILRAEGAGRSDQGDVAFTSIDDARALAGVSRVLSAVRVVLEPGTDTSKWIEDHKARIGRGLEIQEASAVATGFKQFLAVLGAIFAFFAAITLFVGAFLIYLTLSMAIVERTRSYGTMRALGATRRQVARVVLAEAAALGAVSTVLGLALGLAVAKALLAMISNLFEFDLGPLTIPPAGVLAGVAVGLGTTLAASIVPARRAARLSPVVAMRGDYGEHLRLSRAWMLGLVCAAVGVAAGIGGGERSGALATPLLLLGSVLLVPLLLRPLARLLGRLTHRMARGVGDVAVLHLVKERSRSAYTLALIMVVMAMIFSIGAMQASITRALELVLDRQFGADLTIGTSVPLEDDFARELDAVEGVEAVTPVRFAELHLERRRGASDRDAFASIIDPDTYFKVSGLDFEDGTEREARAALRAGGAVLVPETQADQLGVRVGDTIRAETARGVRELRVAATYRALAVGPPQLVLGIRDGRRLLNVRGASVFQLNVEREASVEDVRARIQESVGRRFTLELTTASAVKEEAREQLGRYFAIFYAILLVAALVGLLGLANTLAMSVLQRYREIGVLRAIGTTRAQVRRMVLVESATLGLVAFVLSLPLGLLLGLLTLNGVETAMKFDVPFVYPAAWVPLVAAFGVVVTSVAALAPGRRAARLDVVTALQYE